MFTHLNHYPYTFSRVYHFDCSSTQMLTFGLIYIEDNVSLNANNLHLTLFAIELGIKLYLKRNKSKEQGKDQELIHPSKPLTQDTMWKGD